MTRFVMVIDTRTCIGCGDCVVACKTENKVPEGLNRDWVVEATSGTYPDLKTEFRSERCNHCSNATCVTYCPTGASHHWNDTNIVLVDADKCTFCHHHVDEGLDPACVSTCPTRCMYFGSLDDPGSEVSRLLRTRQYKVLHPETGNEPNVYYLI